MGFTETAYKKFLIPASALYAREHTCPKPLDTTRVRADHARNPNSQNTSFRQLAQQEEQRNRCSSRARAKDISASAVERGSHSRVET